MLFVALFSESSASLPVLLLIFWQLLLIELLEYFKTSGSSQAAVLDISEAFYRAWHTVLLYKFGYMVKDLVLNDFLLF